jgi:hypothetical protein
MAGPQGVVEEIAACSEGLKYLGPVLDVLMCSYQPRELFRLVIAEEVPGNTTTLLRAQ